MRELDRVLRDFAETGQVDGAERLIERLQRRLSGERAPVVTIGRFDMEKPRADLTGRRGVLIAAAALAAALAVAVPLWLLRGGGDEEPGFTDGTGTVPSTTAGVPTTAPAEMVIGDTWAASEQPWDLPIPRYGEPLLALSADEAWLYAGEHLLHLSGGSTSFLPLPPAVTWVMGLEMTPDGTLWAGTNAGLLSFDGEAWTQRLPAQVRGLAASEDGTVWVGGLGDEGLRAESYWLARWDGRTVVRVDPNTQVVPELGFQVMTADRDGAVWMASTGYVPTDLFRYEAGAFEAVQVGDYASADPEYAFGAVGVLDIAAAPNGDIWIGGFVDDDWDQVVLARYDGTAWTTFDWPFADRSGSEEVLWFGLAIGPDGTVWVNFPGGLGSFDGRTWSVRTVTMAEAGPATALDIAPDGTVWYFDQVGLRTLTP